MIILLEVKKRLHNMKKRNKFAKDLMSPKYRSRVVKPKKGKGSYKRKKNSIHKTETKALPLLVE